MSVFPPRPWKYRLNQYDETLEITDANGALFMSIYLPRIEDEAEAKRQARAMAEALTMTGIAVSAMDDDIEVKTRALSAAHLLELSRWAVDNGIIVRLLSRQRLEDVIHDIASSAAAGAGHERARTLVLDAKTPPEKVALFKMFWG